MRVCGQGRESTVAYVSCRKTSDGRLCIVKMKVGAAGKNLQAQYERWQPRAKYKTHLDPTLEDVKKLAISCRRTAKVRVLL